MSQPVAVVAEPLPVMGSTEPRLWTPPRRELTADTSYGYEVIEFAELIGWALDPWEQWLLIHMGELNEDGTPRFRFVLALVARQNGKTLTLRVLILYWLFMEKHKLVAGISASRDAAKQSWRETVNMARDSEILARHLGAPATRETIGEEAFFTSTGATYRFFAPNRRAGRSFTVNRAVLDELREHATWDAHDALINAGNAVKDFQAVAITNQGDATSVVLDSIRDSALEFIETGQGDGSLFLAEWSAPNGADPTDPEALAAANPNLGRRIPMAALMGLAIRAKKAGGEQLARFRTEVLCQRVTLLDAAIDEDSWRACGTDEPVDLAGRRNVALCLDVSLDGSHATLVAAAHEDGLTHVEVVKRWQGFGATKALRSELPGIVAKIKPRVVGWFPGGPAAAVAADLEARRGVWPRNVKVEEIRSDVTAVCMGLAEQVGASQVRHPRDPMLDQHVSQAQRLKRGDAWVFTRRGSAPIDGTYALAGAVHLARMLPPPLRPVVVA